MVSHHTTPIQHTILSPHHIPYIPPYKKIHLDGTRKARKELHILRRRILLNERSGGLLKYALAKTLRCNSRYSRQSGNSTMAFFFFHRHWTPNESVDSSNFLFLFNFLLLHLQLFLRLPSFSSVRCFLRVAAQNEVEVWIQGAACCSEGGIYQSVSYEAFPTQMQKRCLKGRFIKGLISQLMTWQKSGLCLYE